MSTAIVLTNSSPLAVKKGDKTMTDQTVTAAVLVIGDEILSGRTKDQNIGYIARHLTDIGIQLKEVRIVADDEDEIIAAVNALRRKYSYVFTTGGIGPTHDDITADSIAKAFGVNIDVSQAALDVMMPYYKKRGLELTPARRRMARIPDGAKVIENSLSIAPGFMIDNVIVMAGVPKIMQVMLDAVDQHLRKGRPMLSRAIDLERPESEIATLLGDLQKQFEDVSMGSYPSFANGRLSTQLVLRSLDDKRLAEAEARLRAELSKRGLI